jgi:hypothetical protein
MFLLIPTGCVSTLRCGGDAAASIRSLNPRAQCNQVRKLCQGGNALGSTISRCRVFNLSIPSGMVPWRHKPEIRLLQACATGGSLWDGDGAAPILVALLVREQTSSLKIPRCTRPSPSPIDALRASQGYVFLRLDLHSTAHHNNRGLLAQAPPTSKFTKCEVFVYQSPVNPVSQEPKLVSRIWGISQYRQQSKVGLNLRPAPKTVRRIRCTSPKLPLVLVPSVGPPLPRFYRVAHPRFTCTRFQPRSFAQNLTPVRLGRRR